MRSIIHMSEELLIVVAVVLLGVGTSQFVGLTVEKTPAEDTAAIMAHNRSVAGESGVVGH